MKLFRRAGAETGSISVKLGPEIYTLRFPRNGWLAAQFVQFLDEVLEAAEPRTALLKLLGYTIEIGTQEPARRARHWLEIDLERKVLATNSRMIRKAVERREPAPGDPFGPLALSRTHEILDRYDFTVRLFR